MNRRFALIELNVAVLLFGVSGLFGKWVAAGPMTIVFGRTAFAALTILLVITIVGVPTGVGRAKNYGVLLLSGLVLALHWLTFFHAIQVSTVAIGLVGFATFPVFVTFIEPLVFGDRIRVVDIVSAALVFCGLLLVAPSFSLADSGTAGLLWAVVSGFLFAVLALMNRRLVARHPFLVVAFYQHGSATLVLLPFTLAFTTVPEPGVLLLLLVLGVFCTALPQTLFIKALSTVKAQLASVITGLEPVYGIVFAALFLDEIPPATTVLGAIVVFSAVLLAMRSHTPPGEGALAPARSSEESR